MTRLKQNEALEKNFGRYRKRPNTRQRAIVGVRMYDYDEQERSEVLTIYRGLKAPRNKERLFIRNIFGSELQSLPTKALADRGVPLKQMVRRYPSNPSELPFHLIGQVYHCTGLEVFKEWRQVHPLPEEPITAKVEDDQRIQHYYSKYRENWVQISMFTEGRSPDELYYYYHRTINECRNKGRWLHSENLKLVILVEYYGRGKWNECYKVLRTRSDIQIREKFCNILDPKLVVNRWTAQQEHALVRVAQEHDFKWSHISKLKLLGNKTDNEIWRKFRSVMHDKTHEEIERIIPNAELRERIYEYIRARSETRSRKRGPSTTSNSP